MPSAWFELELGIVNEASKHGYGLAGRHPLFLIFFLVLAVGSAALAPFFPPVLALLVGFDGAAAVFLVATVTRLGRASPAVLRASAARNDGGRVMLLVVAALILAAALVAVGWELQGPKSASTAQIALVIATLFLAWSFGNAVFAIHYVHMFYHADEKRADRGGLEFPGTPTPDFWDFVYFAFVLGMTFQVSDVAVTRSGVRRVAAFHGVVAFLFNIGIVALTVNMIASSVGG